jgi:hypothetical protein
MTRKVIDSYQKAILLHQRLVKGEKRGEKGKAFSKAIVRLEIEMFLDGYYNGHIREIPYPVFFFKNTVAF